MENVALEGVENGAVNEKVQERERDCKRIRW